MNLGLLSQGIDDVEPDVGWVDAAQPWFGIALGAFVIALVVLMVVVRRHDVAKQRRERAADLRTTDATAKENRP